MKRLFFLALIFSQICGTVLAEEATENSESIESIFKMAEEVELPVTRPLQFFIGNPLEQPAENLDATFLYQALVNQLDTDFDTSRNLAMLAAVLVVFTTFVFMTATILLYLFFKMKMETGTQEFKQLAKEKFNELKKECAIREHDLQSIVDSQQQVLNELKEEVERKMGGMKES
ncbi:hypothetical protein KAI54_02770 [Candidatus Gracilibacteria bacterium]|nr:hypothetical protein [Candidatus Gracilibacteria bacterium]